MRVNYPDALFECIEKPNPDDVVTDNDLAILIIRQDAVIDDCKGKLKIIKELVDPEKEK